MTYSVRPTNGVSYGVNFTVTSGVVTDKLIKFDFRTQATDTYRYPLVANVQVLTASGVLANPADLAWTYPYSGTVYVTGTFVLGTKVQVVAQRDNNSAGTLSA